tara:strand:+ start:677 stop:1384 length:708 start_codon:yes stop_codon:yes gene_type:complete
MAIPNITIAPPVHKIEIETISGYALQQEDVSYGFVPSPTNEVLIDNIGSANADLLPIAEQATLGGLVLQPDINVQVGVQTNSIVQQMLNTFRYTFPGFPEEEISSNVTPNSGHVCFFDSSTVLGTSETFSVYNCSFARANVNNLSTGAKTNLFIYITYANNELVVLHKGYIDLPDGAINNWSAGKTIYLDPNSVLDTAPTGVSGDWVRSLGFCVPNTQGKKRIWFEADSTYLKIL